MKTTKHEFEEGPKAREQFENAMKAIFNAPKQPKQKPKKRRKGKD